MARRGGYVAPVENPEPKELTWEEIQAILAGHGQGPFAGGRFGDVYEGNMDGKPVVVKIGDTEKRSDKILKWKAEIEYLKLLRNEPHVVKLLGYGEYKQRKADVKTKTTLINTKLFLVYERMAHPLDKQFILPEFVWGNTIKCLVHLAEGLKSLHLHKDAKLVHNDIKPENLLLNENWNLKLGDFGGITKENRQVVVSTPGYVANAEQGMATTKDDIFALGTTLLQLIMKDPVVGSLKKADHGPKNKKKGGKATTSKGEDESPHITLKAKKLVAEQGHAVHHILIETGCSHKKAIQITELGFKCCNNYPNISPDIQQVLEELIQLSQHY